MSASVKYIYNNKPGLPVFSDKEWYPGHKTKEKVSYGRMWISTCMIKH